MKSKNIFSKLIVLSLVTVALFASATAGSASNLTMRQDDGPSVNFCLSEVPETSAFPNVNLVFRVFDQDVNPINNLSIKDIRISENGQTPVPPLEGMQVNSLGLGIDFYIIVDKGNRTDQSSVKNVLNSFIKYYDQAKDQVYIYTDEGNSMTPYFTPNTGASLAQVIADYPTDHIASYRVVDTAVQGVLNEIEGGYNKCQRQKFLFLIIGDDTITEDKFPELVQRAKNSNTKIVVFHVPTESGKLGKEYSYRDLADKSGGQYVSVLNNDVTPFLNTVASHRQSYTLKYRSSDGSSGQHDVTFVYQGLSLRTQGNNYYTINLLPPQATVIIPSIIERTATEVVDVGYLYDVKEGEGSIQVNFPDQFPRNIESVALIINQSGKPELRIPVEVLSSSGDTYKFRWGLGDLGDSRQNDLAIRAEIVDELNTVAVSPDVNVAVISHIPWRLTLIRYYLYFALGVIVILLIIMVLMWRRIKTSTVGRRITEVVQNVRKTLIGGARGKPLASLRIVEGPPAMIGQELKIYTEVIKLGRDPQNADMTFYAPDINSSISGLHARIERVNHAWRIVALSRSGSETFVNDVAIAFNVPFPLDNGQVVRLGYLAQQPVTFEFTALTKSEPSSRKTETDYRKTDVRNTNMPAVFSQAPEKKQQKQGEADGIFDEFRDR